MATTPGTNNNPQSQNRRPTRYDLKGTNGDDVLQGGEGDDKLDGRNGNDLLLGSGGEDELKGGKGNDTLEGGAGDDQLDGEEGNDRLVGGDGDDEIHGGQGDDAIDGGDGHDDLAGGNGEDQIQGGAGNDEIKGYTGDDTLSGGEGADQIEGGSGNDLLDGGEGDDRLDGEEGRDQIEGGAGNDRLDGGQGDDRIEGGAGNDRLEGGSGRDLLDGGAGRDRLEGGAGNDTVQGGAGDDQVRGESGNDQLDGGAGWDRVEGGSGDDLLVYNVSANLATPGDEYLGGSDVDTLRLELSREQWLRADIQTEITAYQSLLAAQASRDDDDEGLRNLQVFQALGLTARDFERFEVRVDGVALDPADEPVVANDDVLSGTDENSSITGNVTANDQAPDLIRQVSLLSQPQAGELTLGADGSFTYDPGQDLDHLAQGETATVSFEYQVMDADGDTDTATASLTITGSNDAPVIGAGGESGVVAEDARPATASGQLAAADVDTDAVLTWSVVGPANGTYGTIAVNETGVWTYTLDNAAAAVQALAEGDSHEERFAIRVADEHGAETTQVVIVTVTGTNDVPVVAFEEGADVGAVEEDGQVTASGQLSATDVDIDAALTWSISGSANGAYGSISVDQTGKWTYTLDNELPAVQALAEGDSHEETFTVQVSDGLATVSQEVTITVAGTDDGPRITGGEASGAIAEDNTQPAVNGQLTATGGGGAPLTWSVADAASVAYGSVAVGQTGQWTYTLNDAAQALAEGESHDETFAIQVADEQGLTATQAVTVTVTGTNDLPVVTFAEGADAGAVQEDGQVTASGQLSATDVDTDAALTWGVVGDGTGTYGSIAVDQTGAWTYTLDNTSPVVQGLKAGEVHEETFTVQVSDEHGATSAQDVVVVVTGTNDAPTATADVLRVAPGTTHLLEVLDNDTDIDANDGLEIIDVGGGHLGTVAISADGRGLLYTPGSAGYDLIRYTVSDATGATSVATVLVAVDADGTTSRTLVGGAGDDIIDESSATDDLVIISGLGSDQIATGSGSDMIIWDASQERTFPFGLASASIEGGGGFDHMSIILPKDQANALVVTEVDGKVVISGWDFQLTLDSMEELSIVGGEAGNYVVMGDLNNTDIADDTLFGIGSDVSDVFSAAALNMPGALLWVAENLGDWEAEPDINEEAAQAERAAIAFFKFTNWIGLTDMQLEGNANSRPGVYLGYGGNDVLIGSTGSDTMDGGEGNDTLVGNGGNDLQDGGPGDDRLDGGADYDSLSGGEGNDTLVGAAGNDWLVGAVGTDWLDGGEGDDSLNGGEGNDTLVGSGGNDWLDGGTGVDRLEGGTGNDVYAVDSVLDAVVEAENGGIDHVEAALSYTLPANVENLTLSGTANLSGTGNELANILTGNAGHNTLNGLAGDDSLIGGAGNDTLDGGAGNNWLEGGLGDDVYYVGASSIDAVDEEENQGTDLVLSTAPSYGLSANVENLTLSGTEDLAGVGNNLANTITGNPGSNALFGLTGNDTLIGDAGNDWLSGGVGDDRLVGGTGNDVYDVDSLLDVVEETSSQDTDRINATVSLTLPTKVENLTLTGTEDLSGTGNELHNAITGNYGNNVLSGGEGDDTLDGGAGNDTLIGGPGRNVLRGGPGNDVFVGADADDVIEDAEPNDLIVPALIVGGVYDLSTMQVPNLTLTGSDALRVIGDGRNNTITGNDGDNSLEGNGGDDSLLGGAGDDTLDGGTGSDTLRGGTGVDYYIVDSSYDLVDERYVEETRAIFHSGGPTTYYEVDLNGIGDTLKTPFTAILQGSIDGIENLTLTGSAAAGGTGNARDNLIVGNDAANVLDGAAGNDTLVGAGGNDRLDGGAGNDRLEGGGGDDVFAVDAANDTVAEAFGEGTDRVDAAATYTLPANVENLTLTGTANLNGTGNELANTLTGNAGHNTLSGLAGDDSLFGDAGNDTLFGGTGNDALGGGTGGDNLNGGAGNDVYTVDSAFDAVVEALNEGADRVDAAVSFTLPTNVENLTLLGSGSLVGTGNELANTITGNGRSSLFGLAGNDTLVGYGTDTLDGGAGDDTYLVASENDVITEAINNGADTAIAQRSYTLPAYVENLTLTGLSQFDGTGNALANVITGDAGDNELYGREGNDTLYGGDGDDALDGGAGADQLEGGRGDDSYIFDSQDTIIERSGEGHDSVTSSNQSVILSAGAEIEEVALLGSAAINATGNEFSNFLMGNDGNNRLDGGGGESDILFGGKGNDTLVVRSGGEALIELAGEGNDTVEVSTNFTLPSTSEVENLRLIVLYTDEHGNYVPEGQAVNISAGSRGTGNELNNTIWGNKFGNILDGGAGNDILYGGNGNDTYIISQGGDAVFEYAFDSLGQAQFLRDGNGNLVMVGGQFVFADAGGYDEIKLQFAAGPGAGSYSIPEYVENLTVESSWWGRIFGNNQDNYITAGAGDDTIFAGTGADTMEGGLGKDFYHVDNVNDRIIETAFSSDTDTVSASVSYTLPANVENLTLSPVDPAAPIDGTGNDLPNFIRGSVGNNILNGGGEADTLIGNGGGDTYIVDNPGDKVFEDANDTWLSDTVVSYIPSFSLNQSDSQGRTTYIDNLTFATGADNTGLGNALNNVITGNTGNDTLSGDAGNDTLEGGAGNDVLDGGTGFDRLVGGAGNDTFYVDSAVYPVIDQVVELQGEGTDTVYSPLSYSLVGTAIENVSLTGSFNVNATGNDDANVLVGNTGNNSLDGAAGNDELKGGGGLDTLLGSAGDDTLVYDTEDQLQGGSGNDTLRVEGAGVKVDLTAEAGGRLTGLEAVDLTGSGNNYVKLEASSVAALSDTGVLRIHGTAGDLVSTEGDWSLVSTVTDGNGDTFNVYSSGSATIEVEAGVQLVAPEISVASLGDRGVELHLVDPWAEWYGPSVAAAGDLNGDGFGDLVAVDPRATIEVSSVNEYSGETYTNAAIVGRAYVVFGGADRLGTSDFTVPGTRELGVELTANEGGRYGFAVTGDIDTPIGNGGSVAAAGDVNGDGIGDLVIGSPQGGEAYSAGNGAYSFYSQGISYVVNGRVIDQGAPAEIGTSSQAQLKPEGVGAYSGSSVASIGDFNGDGFDDVVVGARNKTQVYVGEGAAYVVFGSEGGLPPVTDLESLDGHSGFEFSDQSNFFGRVGASVSSAGDLNGDGFDDLIVGSPGGISYVVFGGPESPARLDASELNGANGFQLNGGHGGGGGDINGDGFDDLIVGDWYGAFVVFGSADMTPVANMVGTYNGYSSSPGDLLALDPAWGGDGTYGFRVALPAGADMVSVDTAGDINGDGFNDFAINTRTHPENTWYAVGVAYIVYGGRDFGASLDLENLDGSNGFRITGDPNALGLGVSVSGAGDLNGDGLDDLVVMDQRSWNSAHAYVIYGQNTSASLMGDAGDNDLTLHGGPEAVAQAGSGDDTIRISSPEFLRIDGGGGTDTLALSGSGTTLDFSQLEANAVQGIEVIDLGNGGNSLYITPRQAAAITDGKVLQIDGDTSDHVTLLQGSVKTVGAEYTTYKFGGIEIQVANTIGEVREINVAPHFLGTVARVPENQTTVTFPVVDDNGDTGLTYAIAGGADASKFTIDPATGLLSFKSTPNFEAPADAGADNVYDLKVRLSDGVASRIQDLQITVTNLNEAPSIVLASAASGQIINGSFETPDLGGASGAPLFGQNPSTQGWSGVYVNHVGSAWQAADGAQSVDLSANLLGEGRVQQTLQTVPGVQYTVTFNFAGSPGYGPSDLEVYTSEDNGFHAITSKEYSFDQANSASDMRWQEETFTFVATGTSTTLVFASRDGQSEGGPALDNVRVSEGGFVTDEDTPVVITGMSITDPDDNPAATISVDLFVGHGSLEPINPSGANVSYYDDASVTHLVLWGSLSQINAALSEGIRYTPDANYNQSDSLAIGVHDGLEVHATVEITVNPVDDADVFELPVLIEPVFINGAWKDFGALIASYGGPADITAFSKGWLDYDTHYYYGPHTLVRIDYDGGGDNYVNYTPAWGSVLEEPVVDPTKVYPDNPLHNFTLDGPNADKLDFSTLLNSVGAPHDSTAFSEGWLDFEYNANTGNTVIEFDRDGAGDAYLPLPILTLVGVELTEDSAGNIIL